MFAYTREIDDWLTTKRPVLGPRDGPGPPAVPAVATRPHPRRSLILSAAVLAAVVVVGIFAHKRWTTSNDLRIEVTSTEVVARTPAGVEQWRYRFPVTFDTGMLGQMVRISGGPGPGVYFATRVRGRRPDEQMESGTLTFLDLKGRPQRSFSFRDEVTFAGKSYGPPWALTAFAVNDVEGTRRVAVAAHHYVWDPGLVTILDDQWQRRGTFVNAGWIESVRWLAPERLLIAGFSNARDGGMIALLDAVALDGQGPEPVGGPHFCETCGPNRPLRMFVFPRTEINRITGARFNRAVVQNFAEGRLVARTIEMTSAVGDGDVVYEFTAPALDFMSAKFSERYWEMHRMLESEGRIAHTRAQCPDRDGPRQVFEWEPTTGWRTIMIR